MTIQMATDSTMLTDADRVAWLQGLPKAELHLHLEGTVTPKTLVALSQRHDQVPLTMEDALNLYIYTDFLHFLDAFTAVCDRLQTPEDYALVVHEMMKDLSAQGVVHAEVFLAWGKAYRFRPHLDFGQVMAAMEAARIAAEARYGVTVLWILDASRRWETDECRHVFGLAAKWKSRYPSIIGVGLGGDEASGPCYMFKEIYAQAKADGLRLTAHAGESTGPIQGPQNIRDALDMGVERIGHGICAAFDEDLTNTLKSRQTPIEVSVTSNLRTSVCPVPEQHPLKLFIEKGLMVTINSDDPAMFGSNLLEEYVLVQKTLNLSLNEMRELSMNSVRASFLPDEAKNEILTAIKNYRI